MHSPISMLLTQRLVDILIRVSFYIRLTKINWQAYFYSNPPTFNWKYLKFHNICGNCQGFVAIAYTTFSHVKPQLWTMGKYPSISLKLDATFLYSFGQQCGDKPLWKSLIEALRTIYWHWTQGVELLNETYDPHTPLCIIGYQINLIKKTSLFNARATESITAQQNVYSTPTYFPWQGTF